jgi:hypothetical protein
MEKKIQSRALSPEQAKEKPSTIFQNLESGFSILSDIISEGYENLVGRTSRKAGNATEGKSDDDDEDELEPSDLSDDLSVYEALEKSEAEGRATKQSSVVGKGVKGVLKGKQGIFNEDIYGGIGGYGGGTRRGGTHF